jgi:hypothetical protein
MSKNEIIVRRPYSIWRIRAYECEVDLYGNPVKRGKSVKAGWYGVFTSDKLENEIVPKLSEYAAQENAYPFLIVSYQLEDKSKVTLPIDKLRKTIRASDIKHSHRQRHSIPKWVAVVYSAKEYRILPEV